MQRGDDDFFVGYSNKIPAGLVRFLMMVTVGILVTAALVAFALGAGTTDPGNGRHIGGNRNLQKFTGLIQLDPYPILRVMPGDGQPARALPLTGQGKWGVYDASQPLDGQLVDVEGFFLRRGDLDMLVVKGGVNRMSLAVRGVHTSFEPAEPVPLGR